ncbi:hypothetical protein SP15_126 [Bacillus phage SP-15]|uniref:Uncharacterized protein n=1 Tax=Bacillus phage SP-15 TaxID=1792032 RepID=A0A127AXG5_9CAUD|nr:hypothetical protein SP15_126 [Bacillus phage SP-15]AMM44924.1 hypothetical protein SP15_126 [Bacillus phage SP-15]
MYNFSSHHDSIVKSESIDCKTHLTEEQIRTLIGKRVALRNTVPIADDSAPDGVKEETLQAEYLVAAYDKTVMVNSSGEEVVTWTIYGDNGQGQKLYNYLTLVLLDED